MSNPQKIRRGGKKNIVLTVAQELLMEGVVFSFRCARERLIGRPISDNPVPSFPG